MNRKIAEIQTGPDSAGWQFHRRGVGRGRRRAVVEAPRRAPRGGGVTGRATKGCRLRRGQGHGGGCTDGYGEQAWTFRYVSAHSSELGLVSYEILLSIYDRRWVYPTNVLFVAASGIRITGSRPIPSNTNPNSCRVELLLSPSKTMDLS